ncbi:MAG TPA: ribosome recycling factor [Actinomycetota bacterium]|nr:ribosome recycling factor [Actinomycetota bacterium]
MAEAESKMRKAIAATREEFAMVRTGRASPHLLDRIEVDYYGSKTPVGQIAGISIPEARMMVISPYDKNALGGIEKAILASDLGINPSNDGNVIRLAFPPLTEERRKGLIRVVRERAEEGRVAIRNIRRHSKDEMERMQRDSEISKDDLKRVEKELQKLTDHYVEEIDKMVSHKEQELLEV